MGTKEIKVPDVGSAEVDVIEVLVKAGDTIAVDAPIVTLESDKATMEVPSSDAGKIKEVKVKVGDKITTGSVILTLESSAENATANHEAKEKPAEPKKPETKTQAPSKPAEVSKALAPQVIVGDVEDIHAGPVVRKLAREFGIPLNQVPATGPKNRILKEDIQEFVKHRLSQVATSTSNFLPEAPSIDFAKFGEVSVQPLSRIKKISGKNLHRNWLLVPHVTQFGDADITDLEEFRQSQKAVFDKLNLKLTPLVFIMKAVVASLKAFPLFNASIDGDNLVLKNYFNIGVAVDTPDGLVVPVIRDVDQKGLQTLAKELSEISERARKKQLLPQEMQGGCFSISSLGGIGGTAFTPIVNLPEVAILGVSKSSHKPVYQDGAFVPRLMLPLSLSYDHRVIDGAEGARFITHLSSGLSDIRNLLL